MQPLKIHSAAEQVAQHLRKELRRKIGNELAPGAKALSSELGVNHKTIEAALLLLEREGVLEGRGPGCRRRIVPSSDVKESSPLRIGILLFEAACRQLEYQVELRHSLQEEGHEVVYAAKTQQEIRGNLTTLKRVVEKCGADAWLVPAGSREVLEWFAAGTRPVFALAGRAQSLPIPSISPEKTFALQEAVHKMVKLGHRRIVLLTRASRRKPEPGYFERCFCSELEKHGITPSTYNLPDWKEDAAGFHSGLASLFHVTPPTAVILDEALFVGAFMQFCAERAIGVPRDVSLLCADPDISFKWFQPEVSHIAWDSRPLVRRMVRWSSNVSRGKEDLHKSRSKANLVPGGTIGPAPKSKPRKRR